MADDLQPGVPERVWDPLVRLTHWTLAAAMLLNMTVIDEEAAAHVWIGYAAFGVLGLRLLWGFVGPETARFASFPPDPRGALRHLAGMLAGRPHPPARTHNPLGAMMVYALWGVALAVCVSGVMLETDAFWGAEAVEELHEAAANLLVVLAAIHVAGVALESRVSGVNLVRAMIDGVKRRPAART